METSNWNIDWKVEGKPEGGSGLRELFVISAGAAISYFY
jgi:hypothetical protein